MIKKLSWGGIIVALVLFVTFPQGKMNPIPPPSTSHFDSNVSTNNSPQLAVESLYTAYLSCLPDPPENVRNVITVYCYQLTDAIRHSVKNEDIHLSADPLICAQTLPASLQTQKVTWQSPISASVSLLEYFPQKTQAIVVQTANDHNNWEVISIHCLN